MMMNFITLTSPFWGYAAKDSIRLSDFLEVHGDSSVTLPHASYIHPR
jgi:hypothetical protein